MGVGEWLLISFVGGVIGTLVGGFLLGVGFAWGTRMAGGLALTRERSEEQSPRRESRTSTVSNPQEPQSNSPSSERREQSAPEVTSKVSESSNRIARLLAEADDQQQKESR